MVNGYTFFASQRMKKISSFLEYRYKNTCRKAAQDMLPEKRASRSIPASATKKPIQWMSFFSL